MTVTSCSRYACFIGLLLVGGLLFATGAVAQIGGVQCGDVISVDTTLTEDLRGCTDIALTVEAGATLDLAGHAVEGTGGGTGIVVGGIVTDGTVQGFSNGILAIGTPAVVVDMKIRGNTVGIRAVSPVDVEGSLIADNSEDGFFARAPGSHVVGNEITGNGGNGIEGQRADQTIADNLIARNGGAGIFLEESIAVVRGNEIRGNARDGLRIGDGCPFLSFYRIGGNELKKNGGLGINIEPQVFSCSGIDLVAMFRAVDEGNNSAKQNGDPRQCLFIFCGRR